MTTFSSRIKPSRGSVTAALVLSCTVAATATAQLVRTRGGDQQTDMIALHASAAAGWQPILIALHGDGTAGTIEASSYDPADPQTKDELMEGLDRIGARAKERNEVNLDKNMMTLLGHHGGKYAELGAKVDLITVRNYEFANKDEYRKSDLDALRRKLEGSGWEHLVRNEEDGETNDIVVRTSGDGYISDMVILNAEPREVNVVHLRGHFRMDDVHEAMGSAMGMGASALGMAGAMGHVGGGSTTSSRSTSSSSSHSTTTPPTPPEPPSPPAAKR